MSETDGQGTSEGAACEVMFYHLQRQPLERVLPVLLHKTLQRGQRALVRCGNPLRLQPLSDAIWSWRDEAFIPHGMPEDGRLDMQPVLLLPADFRSEEHGAVPNAAQFLFCVEGAMPGEEDYVCFQRICLLFAEADAAAKQQARGLWRTLKTRQDVQLTYWQQDERGRWERKA